MARYAGIFWSPQWLYVVDLVWVDCYGGDLLGCCESLAFGGAGVLLWCCLDEWMAQMLCRRNLAIVVTKHMRTEVIYGCKERLWDGFGLL